MIAEGGALGGPDSLLRIKPGMAKKVPEFDGILARGGGGNLVPVEKGQLSGWSWHPSGRVARGDFRATWSDLRPVL